MRSVHIITPPTTATQNDATHETLVWTMNQNRHTCSRIHSPLWIDESKNIEQNKCQWFDRLDSLLRSYRWINMICYGLLAYYYYKQNAIHWIFHENAHFDCSLGNPSAINFRFCSNQESVIASGNERKKPTFKTTNNVVQRSSFSRGHYYFFNAHSALCNRIEVNRTHRKKNRIYKNWRSERKKINRAAFVCIECAEANKSVQRFIHFLIVYWAPDGRTARTTTNANWPRLQPVER